MTIIGEENIGHKFEDLLDQFDNIKILLIAVVVAPVIEEIVYRYPLKSPFLSLLFCILSFGYLLYDFMNLNYTLSILIPIWLGASAIVCSILFHFFRSIWMNIFNQHFGFIFYLVVCMFAFMHVYNFNLEPSSWYLAPLLVLPQFILALLLGYIRIRNGIWASIYIHALNNSIPMLAVFFIKG